MLKTVTLRLSCHHYAIAIAPEDWSQLVYCPRCGVVRQPLSLLEWARVKCCSCRHWRTVAGVNKATRATYKHSREYPSHVVQCWQGSKLLFTTTLARTQPELPLFQLPPPF